MNSKRSLRRCRGGEENEDVLPNILRVQEGNGAREDGLVVVHNIRILNLPFICGLK